MMTLFILISQLDCFHSSPDLMSTASKVEITLRRAQRMRQSNPLMSVMGRLFSCYAITNVLPPRPWVP